MRIISKFRDFYDGMARYGVDEALIYERKTIEDKVEVPALLSVRHLWRELPGLDRHCSIMRIGSMIVPMVHIYNHGDYYYFSAEDMPETIIGCPYTPYRSPREYLRKPNSIANVLASVKQTAPLEFITEVHFKEDKYWCKVIRNPRLLDFNVHQVRDPYTVHTYITEYIANQINPEKPTVEIDDKIKLEQHGFDSKISFRHRKG